MMVSNRGSVLRLLLWQWRVVTVFTVAATGIAAIHQLWLPQARIPALPLAVVGGALGIFVSFRTNSAYARWWEGRQLWGRLVNASRMFASQVLAYLPDEGDGRRLADAMVRRHIAYVHALRAGLRLEPLAADADLVALLGEEALARLTDETNPNHALVHANLEDAARALRDGYLRDTQLLAIDETLRVVLDVQGGCERIKKTPLPRGYAFIAERLIMAFSFLFPLATVAELGWFVIPVSVLVCLAFTLISEAGRVLEDPFSTFWNGLPLMALSRTIEVNLRQRLGETDLPPIPGPDEHGILM
ncbi:MAG: bestrophin family ion channel [Polyangiaceae bacterium]